MYKNWRNMFQISHQTTEITDSFLLIIGNVFKVSISVTFLLGTHISIGIRIFFLEFSPTFTLWDNYKIKG